MIAKNGSAKAQAHSGRFATRTSGNERIEGALRVEKAGAGVVLISEDLEEVLDIESRQVWSESGANFADVLRMALGTYNVN